jgi:hypothetical protein
LACPPIFCSNNNSTRCWSSTWRRTVVEVVVEVETEVVWWQCRPGHFIHEVGGQEGMTPHGVDQEVGVDGPPPPLPLLLRLSALHHPCKNLLQRVHVLRLKRRRSKTADRISKQGFCFLNNCTAGISGRCRPSPADSMVQLGSSPASFVTQLF